MFSLKTNIPKIKDKMARIQKILDAGWQKELVEILEKTCETVTKLTPRSEEDQSVVNLQAKPKKWRHIQDGWTLKVIGGNAKSREPLLGVIYNKFTHTPDGSTKNSAKLVNADGTRNEYTLLDILEYGSRSHPIDPVNSKLLCFIGDDGRFVSKKHVDHPGTAPRGMVRLARAFLEGLVKKFTAKWRRDVQEEWAK